MSSGIKFYQGKEYWAYIDPDGKLRMNGGIVDPGSNAKSGVGLDIDEATGKKVIIYTNTSGKLCTYTQNAGDPKWYWASKDVNAK